MIAQPILGRRIALSSLACALLALNSNSHSRAADFAEAPDATAGARMTGTWVMVETPSNTRREDQHRMRGAPPPGYLTVATDGRYMMFLGCGAQAGDTANGDAAGPVCRGHAPGAYAVSGRLHADASRIQFQIDHSTISAMEGTDLRTAYALSGNQLTLTFDAAPTAASAGMQVTLTWQRLSGGQTALMAVWPAGECSRVRTPAQDLDRSALNEARVDH